MVFEKVFLFEQAEECDGFSQVLAYSAVHFTG
jgi:hypothetical protein